MYQLEKEMKKLLGKLSRARRAQKAMRDLRCTGAMSSGILKDVESFVATTHEEVEASPIWQAAQKALDYETSKAALYGRQNS